MKRKFEKLSSPSRPRKHAPSSPPEKRSPFYLYLPFPAILHHADIGRYLSFGIAVFSLFPPRLIACEQDVSPNFLSVFLLSMRCLTGQLYPSQLHDVAEDHVNS